jgi:hypothetical protein
MVSVLAGVHRMCWRRRLFCRRRLDAIAIEIPYLLTVGPLGKL